MKNIPLFPQNTGVRVRFKQKLIIKIISCIINYTVRAVNQQYGIFLKYLKIKNKLQLNIKLWNSFTTILFVSEHHIIKI